MKKKTWKKVLSLLLAGTLCLSMGMMAAAEDSTEEPEEAAEEVAEEPAEDVAEEPAEDAAEGGEAGGYLRDKITCSVSSDASTMDPFTLSSWGQDIVLMDLIYQGLGIQDSDDNVHLVIAKSFEEVDELTYTLTIWDNIYDTNGNQVTASDIVYSFQKFVDAGNSSGVNCLDVDNYDCGFEIIDDYTLTWHNSKPFGLGEMEKNLSNCKIITQASYEAAGEDMTNAPVGTGPYKLEDYTVGSTILLEANEDFWMNDLDPNEADITNYAAQNVREIEYQIIQDASSRAIALEMGSIDIADTLDAADIEAFADNPDITLDQFPQTAPCAFIFNCGEDSLCSNLALRQAILYAIDNEEIAAGVSSPSEAATCFQPRISDIPEDWTSPERDYYNYDPDKAQELLDEAGYNGEELTLLYNSYGANDDAALIIQAELNAAGINLQLECVEETVFNDERYQSSGWDMQFNTLGGGNHLAQVLQWLYAPQVSAFLEDDLTPMQVQAPDLDAAYEAILNDGAENGNADAWDQIFTYDEAYGYAVLVFNNQSGVRSDVVVSQGNKYAVIPSASTFTD